jgi:hypothetical protein
MTLTMTLTLAPELKAVTLTLTLASELIQRLTLALTLTLAPDAVAASRVKEAETFQGTVTDNGDLEDNSDRTIGGLDIVPVTLIKSSCP